jgi:hypothetical protein
LQHTTLTNEAKKVEGLYLQILAAWKYKPLTEGCRWVYFNIFNGVDDGLVHGIVHRLVHMVVDCFSIWSVGQLKKLYTQANKKATNKSN